jgi:hypothetical protein
MKTFKEAIDTSGAPNLFHKSKQALYKKPLPVEEIMPEPGPNGQRYLELVTSESYKKTVQRLEHYLGKPASQIQLPQLLQTVMGAIRKAGQLQQGHEEQLEHLAVQVVLDLPEFAMFKELIDKGAIRIDAQLTAANLDNAITEQEKELAEEQPQGPDDLTEAEKINLELADVLADVDESSLKRQFANLITQGNAVNKLYLFQLISDQLDHISPELTKAYGALAVIVQAVYYATPHQQIPKEMLNDMAMGSEEVEPEGNGYVINAKAPFFPYLVHEIVKGLYDYLSMDVTSQSNLDKETVDDEVTDIMSGPALYTNLATHVPQKDMKLLPLVYKLLLQQDAATIKLAMQNNNQSANLFKSLISQAQAQWDAYNDASEDKFKDSSEDEEDGPGDFANSKG